MAELQKVAIGTELKMNVYLDPIDDIHADDYEFELSLCVGKDAPFVVTIPKEEMIRIDQDNYVALVDTARFDAGKVYGVIRAYIPDPDFDDNLRTEVTPATDTGILLVIR